MIVLWVRVGFSYLDLCICWGDVMGLLWTDVLVHGFVEVGN